MDSRENENVHVVCRCRPFSITEKNAGHSRCVKMDNKSSISISNSKSDQEAKTFTFDAVFDEDSTQADLYNKTASRIVDAALDGFNGTIFCYGQTGTGKTFSMQGIRDVPELRGIIPKTFHHIFDHISQSTTRKFLVRISFLEIYNEDIRDLLVKPTKNSRGGLDLKENPETGIYVKDLSTFVVKSVAEMDQLMDTGNKHRSVGSTLMNATSSRSHSIFTITIESSEVGKDGKDHIIVGKLNLVDLAGSERQSKTGASGDRLKEATKINLSLSALGNCISALVDGRSSHIPYRDSKLTRLLQDSLGGNAKTLMIATLSPANYNYEETMSTLRYANRAKSIKNKPKINEDPKDAMLRQYQEEIQRLKQALQSKQTGESNDGTRVSKKIITRKVVKKVSNRSVLNIPDLDYEQDKSENDEETEQVLDLAGIEKMQLQIEAEKAILLASKDLVLEEKERISAALEERAAELVKEQREYENLNKKLREMEEQLIVGGSSIVDRIQQQDSEIQRTLKIIQEKEEKERILKEKLETKQEMQMQMEGSYASMQEEVEIKTKKLKKLFSKLESAKAEISDIQDEFRNEREDLLDTLRELSREISLKSELLDNFIPTDARRKIEKRAVYDEDQEEWELIKVTAMKTAEKAKRTIATAKAKRPICQYAKILMTMGESNARYRYDNILNFTVEMYDKSVIQSWIKFKGENEELHLKNSLDGVFCDLEDYSEIKQEEMIKEGKYPSGRIVNMPKGRYA